MMSAFVSEALLMIGLSVPASILVKATALMALALLAARLARRSRAAVRHLIFAAALAIALMLPVATLIVPAVDVPVANRTEGSQRATVTAAALERTVAADAPVRPSVVAPVSASLSMSTVVWMIWGVGAAVFLLVPVAGLWQIRRLRRGGLPWQDGADAVRRLAVESGIRRPIAVVLDASVSGPMTCGLLRPAIVFPPDAPGWSEDDLRRAVIHELEHVRRADWLVHCLARLACVLYWFHPLVWLCAQRLSLEAERACDDAVLYREEATGYAEQLVTFAQRACARPGGPALAMAARRDLPVRVTAVLDSRAHRGRAGVAWITAALAAAILIVATVSPLRTVAAAQAPLAFEVVSIKRNTTSRMTAAGARSVGTYPGGQFIMVDGAAVVLIRSAYPEASEIAGAPEWAMGTERYDLEAKVGFVPTNEQTDEMLRTMLADRFKLVAHFEQRDQPTYALRLARDDGRLGPELRRYEGDCEAYSAAARAGTEKPRVPAPSNGAPACGYSMSGRVIAAGGIPLSQFAASLRGHTGRIVVDETGLPGNYEFTLKTDPDVTIFTAVREQLGLKLEAQTTPLPVLVIDRMERPTEN